MAPPFTQLLKLLPQTWEFLILLFLSSPHLIYEELLLILSPKYTLNPSTSISSATAIVQWLLFLAYTDYCNSLSTGLPTSILTLFLSFLHIAARVIFLKCKYDHVTSLLKKKIQTPHRSHKGPMRVWLDSRLTFPTLYLVTLFFIHKASAMMVALNCLMASTLLSGPLSPTLFMWLDLSQLLQV